MNHRKKASSRKILVRIIVVLVVVYGGLSLLVAVPFSNILFKPPLRTSGVPSLTTTDAANTRAQWVLKDSVQVDMLRVETHAGPKPIELSAWWIYRDTFAGKPSIIFLAGSGGLDASDFEDEVQLMTRLGFNCLLLDQRGYGASGGELLSHGWFERGDFATVVDTLASRYGIDRNRIGIWAISMGASNAVDFAAAHPELQGLLLLAPWSNPQVMGVNYVARNYSIPKALLRFPVWAAIRIGTMRNHGHMLDPAEEAKKVHSRAIVVYGDQDEITDPALTETLYQSLAGRKDRVIVPGAHHNDLISTMGQTRYLETLRTFFTPLLAR